MLLSTGPAPMGAAHPLLPGLSLSMTLWPLPLPDSAPVKSLLKSLLLLGRCLVLPACCCY